MLGPHSEFIIGSYAMFFGIILIVIVFVWLRSRSLKQRLALLSKQMEDNLGDRSEGSKTK